MVRLLSSRRSGFSLFFAAALVLLPSAQAQEPASFSVVDELPQFQEADDLEWSVPWAQSSLIDPSSFRLDLAVGHRGRFGWDAHELELEPVERQRWGDEFYALATLQVPLENLVLSSGSARASRESSARSAPKDEPVDSRSTDLAEEGEFDPMVAPDSAPQESPATVEGEPQSAQDTGAETALLLAVTREITRRVSATSEHSERRLKSLARRSRWSGLSPELRLRGVVGFDRTTSTEESSGIYPGDTTTRGARDSLAEARLTFRLDRLVFGDGEDSIERQRIQLAEDNQKRIRDALDLFMEWRIASLLSSDVSLPPDDRLAAQMKSEAAMLQLHVTTGGWFEGAPTVQAIRAQLPDTTQGSSLGDSASDAHAPRK